MQKVLDFVSVKLAWVFGKAQANPLWGGGALLVLLAVARWL